MTTSITASMLYDLVQCPHRVTMDLFGNSKERDEAGDFARLLWETGTRFEKEVIQNLKLPFLNLSSYAGDEKERLTAEAMARGESLIYGGRIRAGDLLGDPDLLRREEGGYVPGDIKSGAGAEGGEEGDPKLKKHYAVQLALYADILQRKGISAGRRGFIWDVHGEEVPYDLDSNRSGRAEETLWQEYEACLATAQGIVVRSGSTSPALGGICKGCHWHSACLSRLKATDDLSLIPDLGRSKRDAMAGHLATVKDLAASDPAQFIRGKKTVFPRVGADALRKFHRRARLLSSPSAKPYLTEPVSLPPFDLEIFFDIEDDPMRDLCYLHGFVERRHGDNATERYVAFFAETASPEGEKKVFAKAWKYLHEATACRTYYYSKHERTVWRKLQGRYPGVCTAEDIEALFHEEKALDLYYDVVKKKTEWPTHDQSIKTLAHYLGFSWRDAHPSGAASIEWFHRWVETGGPDLKKRILDYNEDDCRATRVLLDSIRQLPLSRDGMS